MILGEERSLEIIRSAYGHALAAGADSAFALLRATDEALTRFANNTIENSTTRCEPSLSLRVTVGKRLGTASLGAFDQKSIKLTAEMAVQMAKASPETPVLPMMADPGDPTPAIDSMDLATAEMPAQGRAELIRQICAEAGSRRDVRVYGNAVTGTEEIAILNSQGVERYFAGSLARLQVTAISDILGGGIVKHLGRSMSGVNPGALARTAIDKAAMFDHYENVLPGEYEVILEPSAAAETLHHLSYLGFSGATHLTGSSCFAGRLGDKVLSDKVSIFEDPLNKDFMCEAFDYEGVPRQRYALVSLGRIENVAYDLATASKSGKRSTGNGLPPEGAWFTEGPFPNHMVLQPGSSTREELISHVSHGLLVTSFHYTRPLDPKNAVITGMTRNGTFLIRDGQIVAMLPNLRFAVSAIDLLANAQEVGNDIRLAGDYVYHATPSFRTTGFSVIGKTVA